MIVMSTHDLDKILHFRCFVDVNVTFKSENCEKEKNEILFGSQDSDA